MSRQSNRPKAWIVFRKELRDSLRDRRSFVSALIFALIGPLVVGWSLTSLDRLGERGPLELPVVGAERAPNLVRYLATQEIDVVPAPADPESAVRSGDLDFVLVVPEDFPAKHLQAETASLVLIHEAARAEAARAVARVRAVILDHGRRTASHRLLARGLSPELIQPVTVEKIDLSTATSRGAQMLLMLPIYLLMAAFVGGMNVAIDVTAGERERLSLESLLLHPVSRTALAAGKWGAAAALNLLAVALALIVSRIVLESPQLQALELQVGFGNKEVLGVFLILLPLVALGPALQMLISTFATSFKEAQTYLSLLLFLPALPGFMMAFQSLEPAGWMDRVPILGHQTLIIGTLRGEVQAVASHVVLAVVTLGLTAACIAVTARLFQDERIVLTR